MSNSIFRNKLVSRATMAAASILVAAGMLFCKHAHRTRR